MAGVRATHEMLHKSNSRVHHGAKTTQLRLDDTGECPELANRSQRSHPSARWSTCVGISSGLDQKSPTMDAIL